MTITEKHVLFWSDWPSNWKGENRLGKVLDEVREKLKNGYTEEIIY